MPVYVAKCETCGDRQDYYRTVAQRHDTPACTACGGETRQVLTPVRGFGDIEPYQSPIDGRVITGRRSRRYDLERSNCRPWEGLEQERKATEQWRREQEAKADKKLEETIARTLHEIPNGRALM